jgi:primosomal replication protein N
VLRHAPSGIALLDCVVRHQSEVIEAGRARLIDVEAPAIATEDVARRLCETPLDATCRFGGFFANRSRKSKRIVLHITDFTSLNLNPRPVADRAGQDEKD